VSKRATATKATASERVRALPWATILQAGVLIGRRWRSLSAKDRARLRRLVGDSRGRLGTLSVKQRLELRRLVGKLDLRGLAGELAGISRAGRGQRRRHRRRRARA